MEKEKVLVFIEEGIGNLIQTIPTLIALNKLGYLVDIAFRSNFPGVRNVLKIPEVNEIFNMYVERIPNPKSYKKVILTMFGHLEHYRYWKEDFDGVEIMNDFELSNDLGRMNDVEINFRFAKALGYDGAIPDIKINYPKNDNFQYFDHIVCPGSGGENKRWPYFMEMVKELKGRVGIIGGPAEEKINWPPNCVDMTGLLDLDEIASIISKAGIYIGNDSGISHLANATGTPCVIIWGPSNMIKSKPWNSPIAIINKNMQCQPCFLLQGETKCEKEGIPNECLYSVTIKDVIDTVEAVRNKFPYRSQADYLKFWERRKILEKTEDEAIIKEKLDEIITNNGIKGETCLDFGCGEGLLLPVLNKYFKKIDAIDIVKYESIPELNGVKFYQTDSLINEINNKPIGKYDCIVLSRILSSLTYGNMYDNLMHDIRDNFKKLIIIDKIKGTTPEIGKSKPIEVALIEKTLNISLVEEDTFAIGSETYSILVSN
jgi:hypothetical protein